MLKFKISCVVTLGSIRWRQVLARVAFRGFKIYEITNNAFEGELKSSSVENVDVIYVVWFCWFGYLGNPICIYIYKYPRSTHTKDSKMVLDYALFNTHHDMVKIKGKVE